MVNAGRRLKKMMCKNTVCRTRYKSFELVLTEAEFCKIGRR